jgi:hypothetical protein
MDFKKILDEAKILDEKEPDMDWIHDELQDGLDKVEVEVGKKYNAPYRASKQLTMIDNVTNSKKKV